jgi:hypothetical protein
MRATGPAHVIPFDLLNVNNIRRRAQIIEFKMQIPTASCHFSTFRAKQSPNHHVLSHFHSVSFTSRDAPTAKSLPNNRYNYSSVYYNLYIFTQQREYEIF